ncbi:MFS general substrate transporter [Rhizodiscina lignyota]|uniref:MFS general substrate transporter n=1 Tax=Rhizodiscina lignyota TaxID=1504668 RepID=A0A9P4MDV7_9PEZI|nr:MFS general substrate transporter [Rhizodiscina lignyota]
MTRTIVFFPPGDPENPYNWSTGKKVFALLTAVSTVMNSTIGSSLAAGISASITKEWGVTNQAQLVLPTSIYLVGYTVGPTLFGPLSEHYGRNRVMAAAFLIYTAFCLGCALAPNFASFIVFRLLAGIGASCPIAVVGGICADVFGSPLSRGRAMALFMATTTFGPCAGPVISGYVTPTSWRWSFWAGLILTAPGWIMLSLAKETYGPVLLKKRAEKMRKETGNMNIVAPVELEPRDLRHIIMVVLTRPLRMILFEALVGFTCVYVSLVYAIFYIYLQVFPIIFGGVYGWTIGEQGLAFLAIGVGAMGSGLSYLLYDKILANARARDAPWSRSEEFRRLPLACAGGPFIVLSCFWIGWSAKSSVHWIVPVLSGLSFGLGYLLIFMALLNYLVDAYEIFAASAMAATSMSRSLFGAVLPFAAKPMYDTLGIAWGSSLLGFLSIGMCFIPFAFIIWGDRIRANSKFCQHLAKMKEERQRQEEREREKAEIRKAREVAARGAQEKAVESGVFDKDIEKQG